ncbi:DHA2 family efflux MFS transporter permease subunit [Paludisphaera mucosa]|uniref:DHA2 family efflux MFS transporter permease subunit n=1 Tax=Paludisphaera mucosa TaxID=3030827 RepID=A0ABT6FJD9_9BACT|nr:DHA2 family efflux MFS transporter permease subunit [Paludisphaera mucosa]MDG3007667.1 DHA2 family efflux MFS transporter permease subunit [Paludisphaera mucosa]
MSAGTPRRVVNPWLVALTVTIATFMEVLDTSIANVALPHIAGSLGASQDDANWVLTGYLVANAMIIPLSSWLSTAMGRKRYYMTCVALFTVTSALCGLATSLPMLILWRVVQGLAGGGLQPVSQAILLDTFPASRRAAGMAVYGVAALTAPVLGPTLGGWITDNYSWRWIFYINIPAGLLALGLNALLVADPEYLRAERARLHLRGLRVDYVGIGLFALGLGCLEVVLDKGQEWDWFGSHAIITMTILTVAGLGLGVAWELRHPEPFIDLRLLGERNFRMSCSIIFLVYAVLFGSILLLPLMMQSLMRYDATNAGLVLSPAGLFSMIAMVFSAALMKKGVDARWLIAFGGAITAYGSYIMVGLNLQAGPHQLMLPRVVQMAGAGLVFAPLTAAAVMYLPATANNRASALFNMLRNEGSSIGIGISTAVLQRRLQHHTFRLTEGLQPLDPTVSDALASTGRFFTSVTGDPERGRLMGLRALEAVRDQQAYAQAFLDCFWVFTILSLATIPLAFLMKRSVVEGDVPLGH